MTPVEAYEVALVKVWELHETGIEVKIRESRSRTSASALEKYGGKPGRIPADKWIHVTFVPKSDEDYANIREQMNILAMAGMRFDTGGGCGGLDWELDWSFRHEGGQVDEDWRENMTFVTDLIQKITKPADNPVCGEEDCETVNPDPNGGASSYELGIALGKTMDEALDFQNDIEKLAKEEKDEGKGTGSTEDL